MKKIMIGLTLLGSMSSFAADVNKSIEGVWSVSQLLPADGIQNISITKDKMILHFGDIIPEFSYTEFKCENTSIVSSEGFPEIKCTAPDGDYATYSFETIGGNQNKVLATGIEDDGDKFALILERK